MTCDIFFSSADMMPNTRLGKRSPFGALVGPETTRPGVIMATGPQGDPQAVSTSCGRSVSTCINVPRRLGSAPSVCLSLVNILSPMMLCCSRTAPQEVDMDELMAAMVLSSLSCSPPQGSAHKDTAAPLMDAGAIELSDSGSSGYWSVDPRSPAPSSPTDEAGGGSATPPDEGLDMELDQVLFEEPAPRKRRVSMTRRWRSDGGQMVRWRSDGAVSVHPHPEPEPPKASSASFMFCGATFRVRSVSVGEQWLQQHSAPCRLVFLDSVIPSAASGGALTAVCLIFRRIRSEAKKCRKVYGIEHRELWCTACRWKKACQRFLD
uniref:Uncharacterized protein n=1 Tax=Poecilia reticulata TaxID=8081 RepID=A0A3P9NUC9_POERE